jgi:hypothetical protein
VKRRWAMVVLVGVLAGGAGCSSGGGSPSGTGGGSGSGGGGGGGAGTSGAGTAGTTGSGGGAGTGGSFLNAGACGERGMATATATTYDGTAEFYIIGEAGLGSDVCVVRYDVKRTGAGPAGCTDPTTGAACSWSHQVMFSNMTVVTNMDGACDASDSVPPLDAAGRAQINAMSIGRGFSRVAGHGDSLMKYEGTMWTVVGRASWDMTSGSFGYDLRTGACNYGR